MSNSAPFTGLPAALRQARHTRQVEIGPGALLAAPHVFQAQFGGRDGVIVADTTTHAVAGATVATAFGAARHPLRPAHLFAADGLYAEMRYVEALEASLRPHDAIPIAVGSGTINDLVKLAAGRLGRPYLSVATAASMDGYTAFGASITSKGSKQTFDCPAPAAVVADLDILAAAPGGMTASGYADLLAKVTAGADWILADALGIESIDRDAWSIVQGSLREALADPDGVRHGRADAIRHLVEGLLMCGFAMQRVQSSRAGSGAEHQFSHLWDMQHHMHHGAAPSHGFKVGVATVACAELYAYLLAQPLQRLDCSGVCACWPDMPAIAAQVTRAFPDPEVAEKAIEETTTKYLTRAALTTRLTRLRHVWPDLSRKLREQLLPAAELRAKLSAAGAPCEPEQIGISRQRLRDNFQQASYIRRRYTVLDLVSETGLLNPAMKSLFGPEGCWPIAEAAPDQGSVVVTGIR